jgi:hypothetical protein
VSFVPAFPHLRPALALVLLAPALAAQDSPSQAERLISRPGPVLFTFVDGAKAKAGFKAVAEEDALLDLGLVLSQLGADPARSSGHVRQLLNLGPAQWALVAPGRELLLSGNRPPAATDLVQALRAAGIEGPVQRLRAFLKTHPDHLEARAQLLSQLRSAAILRSHRLARDEGAPVPDLADPEDQRIWGALAREVDASLRSGDWLAMAPWQAGVLLPDGGREEARSPLMKGVYRRHLQAVEAELRATPASAVAWSHWVWMALVLGDVAIAEVVAGLEPLQEVGNKQVRPWLPFEWLRPVRQAVARTRDWGLLAKVLGGLWRLQSKFWLEMNLAPEATEQIRSRTWAELGRPLLEAVLRQGDLGAAQELVGDLARHPEGWGLVAQAAALARSLGKPDLAREWEQLPAPPPKARNPGMWYFVNPLLVIDSADLAARGAFLDRIGPLQEHAIGLNLLAPVPKPGARDQARPQPGGNLDLSMREFLGWPDTQNRWALVGPDRKLIDQGPGLPEPEAVVATYEAAGYRSPLTAVQAFLREHPGHLEAQARLAENLRDQGHLRMLRAASGQRLAQGPPPPGVADPGPVDLDPALDERCFGDYARALEQVLQSRLWKEAEGGQPVNAWPWYLSCRQSPLLRALARKWLPEVERALERAPHGGQLWLGWNALHEVSREGSLKVLLERLEPGPLDDRPCPPRWILEGFTRECREAATWPALQELMESQWQRLRQKGRSASAAYGKANWSIYRAPLVEALLQQGRPGEADEVVQDWVRNAGEGPSLDTLSALAEKLQLPALAAQWRKRP